MNAGGFEKLSNNARAWIVTGAVAGVVALCLGAAMAANRAGWVPHRQETTVYIGVADWAKGEYRNCVALPETNGSMIFLGCVGERRPEMSPEVWPVTYWGQTRRRDMYHLIHENPGYYAWKWRCRRYKGSLTCWALN